MWTKAEHTDISILYEYCSCLIRDVNYPVYIISLFTQFTTLTINYETEHRYPVLYDVGVIVMMVSLCWWPVLDVLRKKIVKMFITFFCILVTFQSAIKIKICLNVMLMSDMLCLRQEIHLLAKFNEDLVQPLNNEKYNLLNWMLMSVTNIIISPNSSAGY